MSTDFKVTPPIAVAALIEAGCKQEVDELGWATASRFPIKMPSAHFVWVAVENSEVIEFTRFGGNDPSWMIYFCEEHNCQVIDEHSEGFYG